MDPGREEAVEGHVAEKEAFIARLRKRLEASDEQATPASAAAPLSQAPAVAAADAAADAQSWEPEDASVAAENASRQSVHVRCTLTALLVSCIAFSQKILRDPWVLLATQFYSSSDQQPSATGICRLL